MSSADLLPARHSGFEPGHSTVTAVLREVSDILLAIDRQVKSSQVLRYQRTSSPVVSVIPALLERSQYTYDVEMPGEQSSRAYICGVPQGSV